MGRPVIGLKWSFPSGSSISQRRQILLQQQWQLRAADVALAAASSSGVVTEACQQGRPDRCSIGMGVQHCLGSGLRV